MRLPRDPAGMAIVTELVCPSPGTDMVIRVGEVTRWTGIATGCETIAVGCHLDAPGTSCIPPQEADLLLEVTDLGPILPNLIVLTCRERAN